MSKWHRIENIDDITITDDDYLDILIDHDRFGNVYVEIPIELIKRVLGINDK